MNTRLAIAMTLCLCTGPLAVHASEMTDAAKDRVEATEDMRQDAAKRDYEAAKAQCEQLAGNAKDVCEKDAEARYESAKAEAEADEESSEARIEASEAKADANYEAAVERCDDLSGEAKDACVSEAKLKYKH